MPSYAIPLLSFHSYAISQHFRSMPSLCILCYSFSRPDYASLRRFISKPFPAMLFRCDAVHRLLSSTRSNSFSMYCYSISMLITAMPSHIAAMLSISFTPHCCAIPSPHLSPLCLFVAIPFLAVSLLCCANHRLSQPMLLLAIPLPFNLLLSLPTASPR